MGETGCILHAYSVEFQRFNNLNVKHEHMATLDANSYRDILEEGNGWEQENRRICEIRLRIDNSNPLLPSY